MTTSETITTISEALIGFHKSVGKIPKDSKNQYFNSKYADLSDILDVIREPLIENGLTILQFPETENLLTTRLLHKSGEWFQSIMPTNAVPDYIKEKDKNGAVVWRGDTYISPQAAGSGITYARRYAQAAILNLNIGDDDGNAASGKIPAKLPAISKTQLDQALARIAKGEKDIVMKLQKSFTLTPDQLTTLNKKPNGKVS